MSKRSSSVLLKKKKKNTYCVYTSLLFNYLVITNIVMEVGIYFLIIILILLCFNL